MINYTEMQNTYVLHDPNRESNDENSDDYLDIEKMSQMEADARNQALRFEKSDLRWVKK